MTKNKYLSYKKRRKQLHHKIVFLKLVAVIFYKIPKIRRDSHGDVILEKYRNAVREYNTITDLINTCKLLRNTQDLMNMQVLNRSRQFNGV